MKLSFDHRAARIVSAGTISTFGGPNDAGMRLDEGVSLYHHNDRDEFGLFLPGRVGYGRGLDPHASYCALRWTGKGISYLDARHSMAMVRHNDSGKQIVCHLVDWGPAEWTGRLIDVSPAVMQALTGKTDDIVTVVWPYCPADDAGQ